MQKSCSARTLSLCDNQAYDSRAISACYRMLCPAFALPDCKTLQGQQRLAGPQDSAMDHRTNGRLGRATSHVPGLGGPRAEGAGELLLERTKTLQASPSVIKLPHALPVPHE